MDIHEIRKTDYRLAHTTQTHRSTQHSETVRNGCHLLLMLLCVLTKLKTLVLCMEKKHPWTIFLAFNFLTLLHIDTGRENEKEKKDSALEIEQTLPYG